MKAILAKLVSHYDPKSFSKNQVIVLVFAILLFLVTFIAPLWEIGLWAPQYPEGLAMQIWTYKLTGDVSTINILNHYIGMAAIHAEDFPEFKVFPPSILALTATGILAALTRNRLIVRIWLAVLLVCVVVAGYDFYAWEYKFGHELNPEAAIKVEDTAYQPPFIGERTILNISASSWPSVGGLAMMFGTAIAFFVVLFDFIAGRKKKKIGLGLVSSIGLFMLLGCTSQAADPIVFGQDDCTSCKMTISDKRFGAEIVTKKGKSYKFDALECMVGFLHSHKGEVGKVYVVDSADSGKLIVADQAVFVFDDQLRSPMGAGILVSKDEKSLVTSGLVKNFESKKGIRWPEVLTRLESSSASSPGR